MLARTSRMPLSPALRDLFALTKPRLSAQVMITCGGGMLFAPTRPLGLPRSLLALLATAMVVGAANTLNSFLERDLDRRMARTSERPLPARRLDPRLALASAFVLAGTAVPTLTLAANPLTAVLAVVALASYVLVYTPMKQRSPLAMWVGGLPGALPPLIGWTAERNRIEAGGLILFAILFCWQIPHFIAIAIFRRDEYANAGHRVITLTSSDRAVKIHAFVWTALLVASSLELSFEHLSGVLYTVVAAVLGVAILAWSLLGFFRPAGDTKWARRFFFGSIAYLTVLFAALVADAAITRAFA